MSNIDIKISADVANARVNLAQLNADLKVSRKTLDDLVKSGDASGITDELKTAQLAAADTTAKLELQKKILERQVRSSTAATIEETVATEVNTGAHVSGRAAREALVLVHEALSGNYHRMAGSLMIEAQAMAGATRTANAFSAVFSPLGIGIVGATIAIAASAVAMNHYDEDLRGLTATVLGTGAAAGLTSAELGAAAEAATQYSGQSVRASLASAEAFASAGVKSQAAIQALTASVQTYAELTGQKAADAQKELAAAMQDPVKGAQDLNEKLGILDGTQIEEIRSLVEQGDKTTAINIILDAYAQRVDTAHQAGVGLNSIWQDMAASASNLFEKIGAVNRELLEFAEYGSLAPSHELFTEASNAMLQKSQQHLDELNKKSADAAAIFDQTPEGRDRAKYTQLLGDAARLNDALKADTELHGANSDAVLRDKQALEEYSRAINSYLPAAEKAHKISELDAKIAEARHGHNKQLVDDLTRQKTAVQQAGEVMSFQDARQAQADAGKVAEERGGAGHKAHGPSVVQEWAEQLHQQEVLSNDFFSDQTTNELKFWQSKLGLVKAGSKEWLEVQSHVYEAQKSLAHQDYSDHLADLNQKIEADHDNWAKEKSDWQEKLDFIRSKYGEQSTEYKNAYREWLSAERQHQEQMRQAQRDGEQKQLESLKQHLSAMRQVRQEDARTAESVIQSGAGGSPLGEIEAARKIAQLHLQLNQQELADTEATYAAENALRDAQINRALTDYTADSKQYQDAVAAKSAADRQYYDQRAQLEARARAQSIQDILSVQQAYHSYIDGVVGATTSGFVGLVGYTQTWQQAVSGVYNSLLNSIDQVLNRMVTNWIVKHVFMTSAQRAQLAVQTAQHTSAEAAKTGVTTAGVAARAGAESTGFFSRILGLLGIHLGAHAATEAGKTAATIAGSTARATAETTASTVALAANKAAAVSQIATDVALAGAGGVASMAAAPFPLDLGAPAFGAAMAATAASFGSIAAFAQGTNEVPSDMIAQIHAGERIIPAADNRALMAAINDNAGDRPDAGSRRAAAQGGDHHWHYHDHTGTATPEQIERNHRAVAKAFKRAYREGHFSGMKI